MEYVTKYGEFVGASVIYDEKIEIYKEYRFISFKYPETYDIVLKCNEKSFEGRK